MRNGLRPTKVFETFWRFAAERQAVFFRRVVGASPPWTDDPILGTYKFTNPYRSADRASQYLIRHVMYSGDQSPAEVFFRIILFKLFNRIKTWELIEEAIGEVSYSTFSAEHYDRILCSAMRAGEKIYSGAYIMPVSPGSSGRKHRGHLLLLARMMQDRVPDRLLFARSLQEVFETLRSYPMLGDFLAYQYAIDLNYSTFVDFSEMEFVVPGPGALRGIAKCFRDLGSLSPADVIRDVAEQQSAEFDKRGLKFFTLWGRPLQLVDCQNVFCEVDKYARLAHPEVTAMDGRVRIKQRYRPSNVPIQLWFPPKWRLNGFIPEHRAEDATV